MWYGLFEFIYTTIALHHGASLKSPTGELSSTTGTNGTTNIGNQNFRPCSAGYPIKLYYNHSNPQVSGCFEKYGSAPCGKNMRFYNIDDDDTMGECDCDHLSRRTLVYHENTKSCYPIFQQGFCPTGMWINVNETGQPFCERNPCHISSSISQNGGESDLVFLNDTCVQIGSSCGEGHIIEFEEGRRLPTCISRKSAIPGSRAIGVVGVARKKCKPGTYRAFSGRCQPKFDFYD